MNETVESVMASLRDHLELCQDLLRVVEREGQELRSPQPESSTAFLFYQQRKQLLPRLDQSLESLRHHRTWWQQQPAQERQRHPVLANLIRTTQDLIMKIVTQDRENEKARLRLGLFTPRDLPASAAQRPHFVSDLYRRHSQTGSPNPSPDPSSDPPGHPPFQ